jgi:hypothetical protein
VCSTVGDGESVTDGDVEIVASGVLLGIGDCDRVGLGEPEIVPGREDSGDLEMVGIGVCERKKVPLYVRAGQSWVLIANHQKEAVVPYVFVFPAVLAFTSTRLAG